MSETLQASPFSSCSEKKIRTFFLFLQAKGTGFILVVDKIDMLSSPLSCDGSVSM